MGFLIAWDDGYDVPVYKHAAAILGSSIDSPLPNSRRVANLYRAVWLEVSPFRPIVSGRLCPALYSSSNATAYSLVGITATYALTASSLTPQASRKLTGTTATYSETASSLTPGAGWKLQGTTATYSFTASSLTPKSGRQLTGASSSYAISASSLTFGRGMTLTGASYAETASDMTGMVGRKLIGATASYVLSGSPANLLYGPGGVVPSANVEWITRARRRDRK